MGTWRGFAVKKGTPQEAIDGSKSHFKKIYDSPNTRNGPRRTRLD